MTSLWFFIKYILDLIAAYFRLDGIFWEVFYQLIEIFILLVFGIKIQRSEFIENFQATFFICPAKPFVAHVKYSQSKSNVSIVVNFSFQAEKTGNSHL